MRITYADESTWNQAWNRTLQEEHSSELLAVESAEQQEIETLVEGFIGPNYSQDFDWVVDHFTTPLFVFTLTLQNSDLFTLELFHKVASSIGGFATPWNINLGYVDAIHDGIWNSADDLATVLITGSDTLVYRHKAYQQLDEALRSYFAMSVNKGD